jgi:integrase
VHPAIGTKLVSAITVQDVVNVLLPIWLLKQHGCKFPLSNGAMLRLMQRLGHTATPDGMRSAFRDWAADTGVDHMLAEMCLAHAVGTDTEKTYRRTDLFERRRQLMEKWSALVSSEAPAAPAASVLDASEVSE